MKNKSIKLALLLMISTISLTSCRGYEREQDRLDRESEGKGESFLYKRESYRQLEIVIKPFEILLKKQII